MSSTVDVYRGDILESRHHVSIAVVDAGGRLVGKSRDPGLVAFWRSCAKPFQALHTVRSGAAAELEFGSDALALACASHNGEPAHVELATRMLAASGAWESDLVCGPHASLNEEVAKGMSARGDKPTKLHNNCSGKHATMIGMSRVAKWGSKGYEQPDHPMQQTCRDEVAKWSGTPLDDVRYAVDGCGVPTFALPLRAMALAWARFGVAEEVQGPPKEARDAAAKLRNAMIAHPFLVAGTGRLDTDLMQATKGAVVSKVGAEGVYCAAVPKLGLGIALKVEDGAARCLGPSLLGLLDEIEPGLAPSMDAHRRLAITNTLGATVGHLEPRIVLDRVAS